MFKNETSTPKPTKNNVHISNNDTVNGIPRNISSPHITSTPLLSTGLLRRDTSFATPPKQQFLSPKRYSLSESPQFVPDRGDGSLSNYMHNSVGPLLASTRYNVNVSTYMDTKSPGLAGRIAQYNEEIEQHSLPTHQKKYDSPGLFPIVHLFKKKPPPLDQKPKTVTVRIASPDCSKNNSNDYNRMLMEGIIKTSNARGGHLGGCINPTVSGPRSVLDALKEISRKRIHTPEEFELDSKTGKRRRTLCFNGTDYHKRYRDTDSLDSPTTSPTSTQKSKRVCVCDEYAASCSSTDLSFVSRLENTMKKKSISISTITEPPKEDKPVAKLINAETQTMVTEESNTETKNTETEDKSKTSKDPEEDAPVRKRQSPVKIFDDLPLERIRKNRLAALIGSLAGNEPMITPKPSMEEMMNRGTEKSDKTLIGILSPPRNRSPVKSDKHVTFNLEANTCKFIAPIISTNTVAPHISSLPTIEPPNFNFAENPVSSATKLCTPTPSPVVFDHIDGKSESTSVTTIASSCIMTSHQTISTALSAPNMSSFSFGNSNVNIVSSAPQVSNFASLTPVTTSSSPKIGGFKFDLAKPSQLASPFTTVDSAPSISFGTTQESKSVVSSSNSSAVGQPTAARSAEVAFSPIKTITSFGTATLPTSSANERISSTTSAPSFKFDSFSSETFGNKLNLPVTTASNFDNSFPSTPNVGAISSLNTAAFTANTTTLSVPTFGSSSNTAPIFGGITTSAPSFGVVSSTTSAFGSGTLKTMSFENYSANTSTTTTAAVPMFNFTGSKSSTGGATTTTPSFGVATTTAPTFGVATTTAPTFGISATNAPNFSSTGTPTSSFGSNAISPAFGGTSTFGTPNTTSAPIFGTTVTHTISSFGTPVSNIFNSPTTVTTNSTSFCSSDAKPMFANTNTSSPFSTPAFVTPNTTSAFGTTVTNTISTFGAPASKIFNSPTIVTTNSVPFSGTNAKPMFGNTSTTTTSSPFGSSSTPAFGTATLPTFGASTNTFGNPKTTASTGSSTGFIATTTPSTAFGSPSTPAFGASSRFGGTSTVPSFGGESSSFGATLAFGAIAPASNNPSFGSTTPTFGSTNSNNMFGSTNTAPVPSFGARTGPAFGASSTTNAFGSPSNNAFGANTSFGNSESSAFSKPQPGSFTGTTTAFGASSTDNAFGPSAPTPAFGTASSTITTQSGFNFTASVTTAKPFVFGAGGDAPKPSFNFTGGATANPSPFGGGSSAFGAGGPPAFGAVGAPTFNATPQQGMFSIGAGSSSTSSRAKSKSKRRT